MPDWTAYEKRYAMHKDVMRAFIEQVAAPYNAEVWEDDCEDYGFHTAIERSDGNRLDVSLTIWDSGEADDGVYGQHGNFVLNAVEEGGRPVIDYAPSNYTADVWTDYTGDDADDEWRSRLDTIVSGIPLVAERIAEWIKEGSE